MIVINCTYRCLFSNYGQHGFSDMNTNIIRSNGHDIATQAGWWYCHVYLSKHWIFDFKLVLKCPGLPAKAYPLFYVSESDSFLKCSTIPDKNGTSINGCKFQLLHTKPQMPI